MSDGLLPPTAPGDVAPFWLVHCLQRVPVRAGRHCAQPNLRRFGMEGAVRASLALFHTHADIDGLVAALLRVLLARPATG